MNTKTTETIIEMSQNRVEFEQLRFKHKDFFAEDKSKDEIVNELKNKGFYTVENYYDKELCRKLTSEIERIQEKYKDTEFLQKSSADADNRIFGAEKVSQQIYDFYNDPFLLDIGSRYLGCKIVNSNTLAAKLIYRPDNLGSGGGWHVDSHHFQFKAIIYLSDVENGNGPFQIIKSSHRSGNVLRNIKTMSINNLTTRYEDSQVQKVIDDSPDNLITFTAKAGTLILVDTSAIHRGMPIKNGKRYTLFNYYYPIWQDIEIMRKKFNVIK